MAEKKLVCFSVVFVAAAMALLAGHAHGGDLCLEAEDVALCRTMVKGSTDPVVATKRAINKLILETKLAKEANVKLGKSPTQDVCTKNFGDAIGDLQRSLEFMKSKDKASVDIYLSSALTDYEGCRDSVAQGDVAAKTVTVVRTHSTLLNMAANTLFLAASLPWIR